jgi:hypothetical protein
MYRIQSGQVVRKQAHSKSGATMIGVRTEQAQVEVVVIPRVGCLEPLKDLHDQLGSSAKKLFEHRFELRLVRLVQFREAGGRPRLLRGQASSTPTGEGGRSR